MSEGKNDTFLKIVLTVLSSLLVACVIGGIKMYADMAVLKREVVAMAADQQKDEDQDKAIMARKATDTKHWKYLSYLKVQIDALRFEHSLPPSPAPDLGDSP